MKFKISRTYGSSGNKPWDGATFERYDTTERRTCSEEYFNDNFAAREGIWKERGENHRQENGCIVRDHKDHGEGWFMDINTLEELIKFKDDCGHDLVLTNTYEGFPELEIYDGYRE